MMKKREDNLFRSWWRDSLSLSLSLSLYLSLSLSLSLPLCVHSGSAYVSVIKTYGCFIAANNTNQYSWSMQKRHLPQISGPERELTVIISQIHSHQHLLLCLTSAIILCKQRKRSTTQTQQQDALLLEHFILNKENGTWLKLSPYKERLFVCVCVCLCVLNPS